MRRQVLARKCKKQQSAGGRGRRSRPGSVENSRDPPKRRPRGQTSAVERPRPAAAMRRRRCGDRASRCKEVSGASVRGGNSPALGQRGGGRSPNVGAGRRRRDIARLVAATAEPSPPGPVDDDVC